MNHQDPPADAGRRNPEAIARMILSYLERTANAEDTIDGIMNWWLVHEEIRFRRELVRQALELLLRRNLIVRRQIDGRITYRLKRVQDIEDGHRQN